MMMMDSEARVLAKILTMQNLLHVAPGMPWLGELLTKTLLDIPGVSSSALYLEHTLVARAPTGQGSLNWPTAETLLAQFLPGTPELSLQNLPLGTSSSLYGQLVIAVADPEQFATYRPHIENTLNIVSLMIENRRQEQRLTALTHKLEQDVFDQVQELSDKQQQLQQLFDEAIYGICLTDPESGIITACNNAFAHLLQREKAEIIGQHQRAFHCAQEQTDAMSTTFMEHRGIMEGRSLESKMIVASGETIDVEITAKLVPIGDRQLLQGLFKDITQRKQMEAALRESEAKFRAIADTSPLAIYMSVGTDQVAEYINPTFTRLFGYTIEDVPSVAKWWPLAYPDESYRQQIAAEWQKRIKLAIAAGSDIEPMEVVVTCKDGSEKTISWGFITTGKQNWAFGQDLTELKQAAREKELLEKQLRQSHKMEAVGTLAGGIAHDFNNLLAIIGGNADIIVYKQQRGASFAENLDNVKNATIRANNLVKQILAFSRQEQPLLIQIDLAAAVDDALKLLRATIPMTVKIVRADSGPVHIKADTTQLQQVLINLCSNAVHAMDEKGQISISLAEAAITPADLGAGDICPPGVYAKLSVADTGSGMGKEILARMYDPFFTTKDVATGTGMGLSVVHGIVENHGGFITSNSKPGQGTTFNLYFPAIEESVLTDVSELTDVLPTGTERILFVDDEECIAETCNLLLEFQGYQVTSVTDSREALELFRSNPEGFDLVFTDQTMPEMSGAELAAELLKIKADIPIILCSGYSAQISEEEALGVGIREFCMKPMDISQLATVARRVLDENGRSA